ncbi:hypothetical protein BC941DRAFT_117346 [Chlamydoabsidia padenii]|nr:hypothetical protein BC941DRAFT_117346 [Chlamydoabsidia padenii]
MEGIMEEPDDRSNVDHNVKENELLGGDEMSNCYILGFRRSGHSVDNLTTQGRADHQHVHHGEHPGDTSGLDQLYAKLLLLPNQNFAHRKICYRKDIETTAGSLGRNHVLVNTFPSRCIFLKKDRVYEFPETLGTPDLIKYLASPRRIKASVVFVGALDVGVPAKTTLPSNLVKSSFALSSAVR